MKSAFASAIRTATDLLFPPRCVHCGADGSLFCQSCEASSARLSPDETCRRCALPSPTSTCEACFAAPPRLDRAVAAFIYQPEIRDAVSALKYNDIRAVAPRLGDLMAEVLPASIKSSTDAIVPVPVSASRLRSRGYNQAELVARQIARQTDLELRPGLLTRISENASQARSASIEERAANVRDAFSARDEAEGLSVLLIDDVMTTGATLNACAAALKSAGAARVSALVLAREL